MTICIKCHAQNLDQARFCQTCGAPLDAVQPHVLYSGFWRRVAASVLDAIIISFGAAILVGTVIGVPASFALPWLYEAAMLSSPKRATVGKMVMGIIVTNTEGKPISFARATGRHFAKYLSGLILGIGFVMAAFTDKKQALHDMIADTLVLMDKR